MAKKIEMDGKIHENECRLSIIMNDDERQEGRKKARESCG